MKKGLLNVAFMLLAVVSTLYTQAQYQKVSIRDVQYVDAAKLANCRDTSMYHGDTITIIGKVIMDGNLCELVSSSVQGGFRPGVHLVDTTKGGEMGKFSGIQVMGTYVSGSATLPITDVYNLVAGMIVEVTGIVGTFQGETQLTPLNNSSIKVITTKAAPTFITVDLGKLNDNTRANQLATGEEYEGSYVELENVTVTAISYFSGNTRISFDVKDSKGNMINVSDRFMAQKLKTYSTSRSTAPYSKGRFTPPSVGTVYQSLKGVLLHSANGCLGGTGRGYELNPFDSTHYKIGDTPPNITSIDRTPLIPKATETVKVVAKITDANGTITGAKLYYSTNVNDPQASFTMLAMTLKVGTTDEFEASIPAQAENTLVRYYIEATDNDNKVTISPSGSPEPNYLFYTVRDGGMTIVDVQKVLKPQLNDVSPYQGKVVTVTGVVVASAKIYDLGYIYIQDPTATAYAGIYCTGNSDLVKLYRTEEVTVTGTVEEYFGFTQLNVTSVVKTGKLKSIQPISINPSDSAFYASRAAEMYEGMLVRYVNPAGGKLFISHPKPNNFADYMIATNENNSRGRSGWLQAGRQNSSNFSSLYVSVVADTVWKKTDGQMEVPAIQALKGQSLDTLIGVLNYGFSAYKVLPRNNDDFRGFSVALEKAKYPAIPGSGSVKVLNKNVIVNVFPNPAKENLNIAVTGYNESWKASLMDISGNLVLTADSKNPQMLISHLSSGLYLVKVYSENGEMLSVSKVIKD